MFTLHNHTGDCHALGDADDDGQRRTHHQYGDGRADRRSVGRRKQVQLANGEKILIGAAEWTTKLHEQIQRSRGVS